MPIKLLATCCYECHDIINDLGQIGDPIAVKPLIHVLENSSEWIGCATARALGKIGDTRAIEPLIRVLERQAQSAACAASALGKIGDIRAVNPLIATLNNAHAYKEAINALGKIGELSRDALNHALQSADPDVCSRVQTALMRVDETRDGGSLLAGLRSDDERIRTEAFEKTKANRNVKVFISYLNNTSDHNLRALIVWTLGEIGGSWAVKPSSII